MDMRQIRRSAEALWRSPQSTLRSVRESTYCIGPLYGTACRAQKGLGRICSLHKGLSGALDVAGWCWIVSY